jgi:glycosyltransferase involved in cell wall biosynthesis
MTRLLRGFGLRRRLKILLVSAQATVRERQRNFVLRWYARRDRPLLEAARRTATPSTAQPLVTVTIATWNRAELLRERTIPALLAQTYQNFEVRIVGDCCTDGTRKIVESFGDPRLHFVNLPVRGPYPDDPFKRHCIAGIGPIMAARSQALGEWIAHLDDDEEWVPEHLSLLVERATLGDDPELLWGRARYETAPGVWIEQGDPDLRKLDIPHSTVMFRTYLRSFEDSPTSYRLRLGSDHHRFQRMLLCGVRTAYVNEVITVGALRPGTTANWSQAEDIQ